MAAVHDRAQELWDLWCDDEGLLRAPEMMTPAWFWAMACAYYERNNTNRAAHYATLATAARLFSDCTRCPQYYPGA